MLEWLRTRWGRRAYGPRYHRDAPLESLRYAVFDTEFTSLDARRNRLLSVGGLAMQGSSIRLGEQFYCVVNPGESVPASSVLIHQLRAEDVEAALPFAQVRDQMLQFFDGAVLVGHFVGIDVKLLRKELGSAHELGNPVVCTARAYRWILRHGRYSEDLPAKLEHVDLGTVAKAYGLEVHDAHHALHDAFLTARVWQRMLPVLEGMQMGTLGKLMRIAGV